MIRISFSWELQRLESATVLPDYSMQVNVADDALVSSIYLASITSLSDTECRAMLSQSRTSLLSQYQILCEEALARTNILCMNNTSALKAMALYLVGILICDVTNHPTNIILVSKSGSSGHPKSVDFDGTRHS